MFGLSQHPFSHVCHHSNPASVTSHRSWSIPVSTQSDFAVFPHENVCQPSSLQSKLRSIKTRLNWLQTVIDGQNSRRTLDEMSKPTNLDWTRAYAHDGRDPRSWPQTKPCRGQHVLEQSYTANPTRSEDQLREMCPSPTLRSSTHSSDAVHVDSVIGFSAGGSEANVTFERQRLRSKSGQGHDC